MDLEDLENRVSYMLISKMNLIISFAIMVAKILFRKVFLLRLTHENLDFPFLKARFKIVLRISLTTWDGKSILKDLLNIVSNISCWEWFILILLEASYFLNNLWLGSQISVSVITLFCFNESVFVWTLVKF